MKLDLENIILHCMPLRVWEERRNLSHWGESELNREGFIHASPIEYFWRVAPNFADISEPLVLLCIDKAKLESEVRYEDGDGCGRAYPHIYGLINNSAVVAVFPFQKDAKGAYMKNAEFAAIEEK